MNAIRGSLHPDVGPIVPVVLRQSTLADDITSFEAHGYAIVDTGATLTGIDEDLAIRLKLPPDGTIELARPGPSANFMAGRFSGEMAFPGSRFPPLARSFIGYQSLDSRPDDHIRIVAIIGRDVLAHCVLTVDGGRRQVLITPLP